MKAKTEQIHAALVEGWVVRYTWATGTPELAKGGQTQPIDGRSYQAFVRTLAYSHLLARKETGSVVTKDLVIEWRYKDRYPKPSLERCRSKGAKDGR